VQISKKFKTSKRVAALSAFFVLGLGVAGCGGAIPGNSVASVGGNPITLKAFQHWTYLAAKEQAASEESATAITPGDPPNFDGCIKQARTEYTALAKTPEKTLRAECASLFKDYRTQVMEFLIEGYWYQAQGYKDGIRVTTAQVQKSLNAELKKDFPTNTQTEFKSYLKSSGETEADLQFQTRVNLVYEKLLKRAQKSVTSADIASYYAKHKSTYASTATANLNLIRTKTAGNAKAAYNALKGGKSWTGVAKQYAEDSTSKKNGGKLTNVASGTEETVVNKAIFADPLNQVIAPIHGEFGYYVIEVTKRVASVQKSLSQVTSTIKKTLTTAATTAAQTKLGKQAKAAWQSSTKCRPLYSISLCAGYKSAAANPAAWTQTATSTTSSTTATGTSTAATTATGSTTTASTTKTSG
jgi:parvulin-like peptidyl-prolyl isomerase